MGLDVNTIITLSNNEKYIVLNETFYMGKKYFLVESKDSLDNQKEIFQEELEGLDIYIKKVVDSNLKEELMNLLK